MDSRTDIPLTLAEVDSRFLTNALREAGILKHEEVVNLDSRVIGEGAGFMGEVVDLRLTLSHENADVPTSMILKIPTATRNRRIGQAIGVYEREIRFYRELQPRLGIRTPRHFYSAMDVATDPYQTLRALKFVNKLPLWLIRSSLPSVTWFSGRRANGFILIIENLGDYRVGDQVAGCSIGEARLALNTMARMHARFWNSEELAEFPWLVPIELMPKPFHMMFVKTVGEFMAHHESWLTDRHIELLEWLKANYIELIRRMSMRPHTLMHGDFRLDNLCFDDSKREVILFDWQTPGTGPVGSDLAYFLSSSMNIDADGRVVEDLLEYYRGQLAKQGVSISRESMQWEYEVGLLAVLHRTVPARFQDVLDFGHGRGNDLIDTWVKRVFSRLDNVDINRLLQSSKTYH